MKYVIASAFLLAAMAPQRMKADTVSQRLQRAATIVKQIMATPEKAIPKDLLNKAVCVAVVPGFKKAAFGIGGAFGRGALVCRRGGTGAWGAPSMFTLTGPSIGFQIGVQSTDLVLVVMNPNGARKLLQSRVKLGADATAAAGPVGRSSEAATDAQMHAEILTYSRSHWLFAGISLEGDLVKPDNGSNHQLYGREIEAKDILFTNAVGVPAAARALDAALTRYSPRGGQKF